MDILTLNCRSPSVKYQLFRWDGRVSLAKRIVERVTAGHRVVRGGYRLIKKQFQTKKGLADIITRAP